MESSLESWSLESIISLVTNKLVTTILLLALALLAKKYRLLLREVLRERFLRETKKGLLLRSSLRSNVLRSRFFCHLPCHLLGCRLALVENWFSAQYARARGWASFILRKYFGITSHCPQSLIILSLKHHLKACAKNVLCSYAPLLRRILPSFKTERSLSTIATIT